MIAIIDYGAGNLFSLQSSLEYLGIETAVTRSADEIGQADRIIVPGVGAFGDAIAAIRACKMDEVIGTQAARGKPIMGICLGMQLLYDGSREYGSHTGLGLLEGWIEPLAAAVAPPAKTPHMGWNSLTVTSGHPLLKYSRTGEYVYYVHSFYAPQNRCTAAATFHGGAEITGVAAKGNVCGCQFHPEKSGDVGLRILRAFNEMT